MRVQLQEWRYYKESNKPEKEDIWVKELLPKVNRKQRNRCAMFTSQKAVPVYLKSAKYAIQMAGRYGYVFEINNSGSVRLIAQPNTYVKTKSTYAEQRYQDKQRLLANSMGLFKVENTYRGR